MIKVPSDVLAKAVRMSERYITDRYLPDKAIDLLDEAAANLSLNTAAINESYEIRDKLLSVKAEREKCEAENAEGEEAETKKYELIAKYKSEEMRLSERLREIEPMCQNVTLTVEDLAEVIEIWTGIPATNVTENEFDGLLICSIDVFFKRTRERDAMYEKVFENRIHEDGKRVHCSMYSRRYID